MTRYVVNLSALPVVDKLQNGEIADVPAEEAAPAERFARPVVIDPLKDDYSSQDSIFCSVCLKNQQLYTYNLSQFLPDLDHPDYEKLEAELPAYKKSLEERYPQCCARCEPKVKAKLHQATYNARSDHLRRVLDKSRQRRIASRFGWRSLLVSAAGLGYFLSLAMQLVWHLYGSQVSEKTFMRGFQPIECYKYRPLASQCLDIMESLVGLSLHLGLLCVWWNPLWKQKLSNNEVNLAGLKTYYMVQLVLLGLRFSAWIIMFHVPLSSKTSTMLHACFAVVITVIAGWSVSGIVKVRTLPPINWHDDPAPLLSKNQFVPPAEPPLLQTQQEQDRAFNVQNLAAPARQLYQEWTPPTPPQESADSMDWTPSQSALQPELKQVRYRSTDPTPFHGTLPALNARGVRKNAGQNQPRPKEALGLPPGFFDRPAKSALPPRPQASAGEAMAEPRFFAHDKEADTGLESIFGTVFSLQDRSLDSPSAVAGLNIESSTVASASSQNSGRPSIRKASSLLAIFSTVSFFSVLTAVLVWIFQAAITSGTTGVGYYIVWLSVCVPVGHFLLVLSLRRVQGQFRSLLLYFLEASSLVCVAILREPFGDLLKDLWNKLAIAAVALLLPQEFLQMNNSSMSTGSLNSFPNPIQRMQDEPDDTNASLPTEMPRLSRQISLESIESSTSIATASTVGPWQTPQPDRHWIETLGSGRAGAGASRLGASSRAGRSADRGMFGLDGLSLADPVASASKGGPAAARKGMGFGTGWGLESSGSNVAGPRSRR